MTTDKKVILAIALVGGIAVFGTAIDYQLKNRG
jgi:hypothetical protein